MVNNCRMSTRSSLHEVIKSRDEQLQVMSEHLRTQLPRTCAIGVDPRLWNEREGNPFWIAKIHSVHKARKRKKISCGSGRAFYWIKKGDWYMNLTYYEQIQPDNCLEYEIGKRDVGLCQSLLIDPGTGHVVNVDFDLDSLTLSEISFNYIRQNVDLFSFKDPASKF